ncbi:MAG: tyrosine--tRNA ligase [Candidatus Marsarchaeota archaeon]|nr:tyrosine--tRNA ligase [Candidatus Marsarchaeota archaeon]
MDVETKMEVMKSFAQEIVTEEDLRHVFETNEHPVAYDGFEPSGIAPIHFGLLRARNLKKMLKMGIKFKLYLADYFGMINNKLGGDLEHIQTAGKYFVEVWKGCGIDTSKVEIIWASELMDTIKYWDQFMRVGMAITLERVKRAITVMGRKEGEAVSAAQLYYPAMQVTDIFQMDVDICQLGIDQRRANILAREIADKYKWKKPAAVHHPLILGLKGVPQNFKAVEKDALFEFKMSKSDPSSAIYMHDSEETIKKKINGAYCPEKIVDGNPLFNYLELILLDDRGVAITIERPQKFGGQIEFENFDDLTKAYVEGKIHPVDLKGFVAAELEKQIKPVREHFEKDKKAKELYETVKGYQITR